MLALQQLLTEAVPNINNDSEMSAGIGQKELQIATCYFRGSATFIFLVF